MIINPGGDDADDVPQMLAAIGETFEVEAAAKDTSADAGGPDLITGLILSARPNL